MAKKTEEGISNSLIAALIVLMLVGSIYIVLKTNQMGSAGQNQNNGSNSSSGQFSEADVSRAILGDLRVTLNKIVKGDVNGDGSEDAVVIVQQSSNTANCMDCSSGFVVVLNNNGMANRITPVISQKRPDSTLKSPTTIVDVGIDSTGLIKTVRSDSTNANFEISFFRLQGNEVVDVTP